MFVAEQNYQKNYLVNHISSVYFIHLFISFHSFFSPHLAGIWKVVVSKLEFGEFGKLYMIGRLPSLVE